MVNEPLSKDSGCDDALIDSVVIVGSTPTNAGSIVVISISSSGIKLVCFGSHIYYVILYHNSFL